METVKISKTINIEAKEIRITKEIPTEIKATKEIPTEIKATKAISIEAKETKITKEIPDKQIRELVSTANRQGI